MCFVRTASLWIAAAIFGAAACSSGASAGDVALTGAGATFPYPLYSKWISEYARVAPSVRINYQPIGSGGGIRLMTEGTVDFGASDAPMTDEQMQRARGLIHVPTCAGAIAIAYHADGIGPGLQLAPETIAGIFLGEIRSWNDPKILADNPNMPVPAAPIVTVHRSDGSGTTKLFTAYLSAVSPSWAKGPGSGTSVSWPEGLGAKGNEGVAALIKSQPASIGYVELAYVEKDGMLVAKIRNRAGQFVAPTTESTTRALAEASVSEDLRISALDSGAEGAYPIVGVTYLLLPAEGQDAKKREALFGFVRWALTEGQSMAPALGYAPLPPAIIEKARSRVGAEAARPGGSG